MNITPEQLKAIAESQGYTDVVIGWDGKIYNGDNGTPYGISYNPLENDSQLLELVEWLLKKGWSPTTNKDGSFAWYSKGAAAFGEDFKDTTIKAVIKELGL